MRSTYRALIAVSVFAVASHSWAQDPNATPAAAPTPVSAQPTAAAAEIVAPAVPAVESTPALEVTPVLKEVASPEAIPAPITLSPSDSPAMGATKPGKPPRVRKPRAIPQETGAPEKLAAAASAAVATSDTTTNPPASTGTAAIAVEPAVAPAPIAEQLPVAPTAAEPAPADRATGSMWLLIGGLLLGIIGIIFLMGRRRRNESISIVEHTGPIPTRSTSIKKDASFAIAPEKNS